MLSRADHTVSPPLIEIPRRYNAAHDLLERNLRAGRAEKIAYIDDAGRYSYGELVARVNRAANALRALGLEPEDRVMVALHDTIDFPSVFLGAIKAGIVPIAVNTLLTSDDYRFMLDDSCAKALFVSAPLLETFAPALAEARSLKHVIATAGAHGYPVLGQLMAAAEPTAEPVDTTAGEVCFWLYSSGSTGPPKGTVHVHSSLLHTAELYARPILGITEQDVVFSAAKLFFAYGLGNSLTFPLAVGATAILMAERPTPEAVFKRLVDLQPSIFYGVPTLYAAMLASPRLPERSTVALRICTSAGEALPADVGRRFTAHFGVDILDGIGSTEMLHIFLSNRPGDVRYGTTGKPVPGYQIRLCDEQGQEITGPGLGELQINGPSTAVMYWNSREKSRETFMGAWTRAGDKYTVDAEGYYTYGGRSDDMLKVSGQYVSPFEVEAALMSHPAVLEAAVVGMADAEGLIKPKAFVVLKSKGHGVPKLEAALKAHVKTQLAPHKYPRWFEFVPELPKTATGKIQRFRLRAG
ncbi:MAG: benzoate-CoA ligase family protein [Gammaproteobacteria bacterium]|nr:benzoate-CoA ligase family protein [Gammaproteobacteria bacterium]